MLVAQAVRIGTALNDAWALPYTLEGFVKLACEKGLFERALRIAGGAARLRSDAGAVQLPDDKAQIDALIQVARSRLSAALADRAWQGGWQMKEREIVDYALSHEEPTASALSGP